MAAALLLPTAVAFSTSPGSRRTTPSIGSSAAERPTGGRGGQTSLAAASHGRDGHSGSSGRASLGGGSGAQAALSTVSLAVALTLSPLLSVDGGAAHAYEESDYASETVTEVVGQLKSNAGDVDKTFGTLEEVAKIITEGKGVGGTLTYEGVKLNEGVVADEDTAIYNPGLSLLTNSEKERLVSAIVDNRRAGLSVAGDKGWSEDNEYAFDFLKSKLDPLHMYEIQGYLKIVPFWGAALYLAAIFVQKNARGVFPLVYGLCALGVFLPAVVLIAGGT